MHTAPLHPTLEFVPDDPPPGLMVTAVPPRTSAAAGCLLAAGLLSALLGPAATQVAPGVVVPYPHPGATTADFAYIGGVHSPSQNRIYFVPWCQGSQDTWHYVDCSTGAIVGYTHDATAVDHAYYGGVYSPTQNRIYFAPNNQADEATWHYVDCGTGAIVGYTHGVTAIQDAYKGGVYSPNQNRIYFVPYCQASQDTWHYVDCGTGAIVGYTHGAAVENDAYHGGVYSPTQNRIYFAPNNQADEATWHYVDCGTGAIVGYAHGATAVTGAYIGGAYSPNQNRIYFVPCCQADEATWHYVDCGTGAIVGYTHGVTALDYAYTGGVYSPTQNRIYFVPYGQASQATWHYVDGGTGAIVGYSHGVTALHAAYHGGVYSPNQNRIYFVPDHQAGMATWHYLYTGTAAPTATPSPAPSTSPSYTRTPTVLPTQPPVLFPTPTPTTPAPTVAPSTSPVAGIIAAVVGTVVLVLAALAVRTVRARRRRSKTIGLANPTVTVPNASFGLSIRPNSASGDGRCPNCASKIEFCICNDAETRRRTMSASSAKVRSSRIKTMQLDRKCAYVSNTGRACRGVNVLPSMQCPKHTCQTPGCFEPKPSAEHHCQLHQTVRGAPAVPLTDAAGYLAPGLASDPMYTSPAQAVAPLPSDTAGYLVPAAASDAENTAVEYAVPMPGVAGTDVLLYDSPAPVTGRGWWSSSPEEDVLYERLTAGRSVFEFGTTPADFVPVDGSAMPSGARVSTAISTAGLELYRGDALPQQAVAQFQDHQRRAMAILGNDPARYDAAWRVLLEITSDQVQALDALCGQVQHRMLPKSELRQPEVPSACPSMMSDDPAAPSYCKWILETFATNRPAVNTGIARISEICGSQATVRLGPPKSRERAEQKAELCYDGDLALVGDYERAEVVCDDVKTAHSVVDLLLSEESPFPIVRLKNRFAVGYPAAKQAGGYRDVQLIGRIPGTGLLFEIQVHIKAFHVIKTELGTLKRGGKTGHGRYRKYRDSKEKANQSLHELVQAVRSNMFC